MSDLTIRCDDLLCSRIQDLVGGQYQLFQGAATKLLYDLDGKLGDFDGIFDLAQTLDPASIGAAIQGFGGDLEGRLMAASDSEFSEYADWLDNLTYSDVPDLWECLQLRLGQFPILEALQIPMVATDNAVKLMVSQLTSELMANLDVFSFFDDLRLVGEATPFPNLLGSIEQWRAAANVLCTGAINNDAEQLMARVEAQSAALGITSKGFSPTHVLNTAPLSASAQARITTMDTQVASVTTKIEGVAGSVLGKMRFG